MSTTNDLRIGIESRGDNFIVTRTNAASGRPEICEIRHLDNKRLLEYAASHPDHSLNLAVPEHGLITKHINLNVPIGIDIEAAVKFEMAQSLLDPHSDFDFYISDLAIPQLYFVAACRPALVDMFAALTSAGYRSRLTPRPQALLDGFWQFGQSERHEFVGFVDLTSNKSATELSASLSFALNRNIVGTSHRVFSNKVTTDSTALAKQLRAFMDIELEKLFRVGITRPLGHIILCGEGVTEQLHDACRSAFSSSVSVPDINYGYLASVGETDVLPEHCLASLGLTTTSARRPLVN